MAKLDFKGIMKDSSDFIKKHADNLPDSIKNIDVNQTVKDLSEKGKHAYDSIKQKSQERSNTITNALHDSNKIRPMITAKGAMQIFYLLMNIDGAISFEEMKRFQKIGCDMDPEFENYKDRIIKDLDVLISEADKEDFYDEIHDGAGSIIRESLNTLEASVDCKLLIWNLLVISYSDNEYNESENRLVKYAAKQCGIEKSIVLEMDSYILTQLAIEKEASVLKESGRQYAEVDKEINRLNIQSNVLKKAIHSLISD